MDYHSLKRKELQTLCKKHNIPANLKNVEMADRLSALFKEENPSKRGSSCLKNDDCDEGIVGSKETKKVKFHSQNETFWFEKTDPREMRLMARKQRGFGKSAIEENPVSVVEDDVQNHSIVGETFERKLRRRSVLLKCGQVSESKTVDDEVEKPVGRNLRKKSAVVKCDQISESKTVDDEFEKPIGRNLLKKSAVVKCDQISGLETVDDEAEKPIGRNLRRRSALVKFDQILELNDKVEEPVERNLRRRTVVVKSDNVLDSKMGDEDKVEKPNERASRRKSVAVKSDNISESKPMVDDEVEKPIERNRRRKSVVVKPDNDSNLKMVDDEGEKTVRRAARRKSVAVMLSKNSDSENVNDKVERPLERASRRKSIFVKSSKESDPIINDDQVEIPIERASRRKSVVIKSSKKSDAAVVDDKAEKPAGKTLKRSPEIAPDTKKGKKKKTTATVKKQEVKRGREAVAEDLMEQNVGGELTCHSTTEHSIPGSCPVGDVVGEQLSSSLGAIKSTTRDMETSESNEEHSMNDVVTLQESLCEELPCLVSSPKNEDAEEDKRIDYAAVIVDGSDVQTKVQDEATGLCGHCDSFAKEVEQTCEFTIDQPSGHFASEAKVILGPEADMETNVQTPVFVERLTLSANASALTGTKVVEDGSKTYTVTPWQNQELVTCCNDAEVSPVVQSLNKDCSAVCGTKDNASECISLSSKPKYSEQSVGSITSLQDHCDSMPREVEEVCDFSIDQQPRHFVSEEKVILDPETDLKTNVQALGNVEGPTQSPNSSASTGTKGIEEGSKTYTTTPLKNQDRISCCNNAEDSSDFMSLRKDDSIVGSPNNNTSEGKSKYLEQNFVDAKEDMEGNVSFSTNNNANLGKLEDRGKEDVSHPVVGVSRLVVRSMCFELSEHDSAEDTNTAANKLESDMKGVDKCAGWKSVSEMDILNRLETLCDSYFAQSCKLTVLSGSKLDESHIGTPSTDFTCFDIDEIGKSVDKNDQRLAVKQPEETNCFDEPELQHLLSENDKDDIGNNAQSMVLESNRVSGTTEDRLSLGGEVENSDVLNNRRPADLASEGHTLHYGDYGSENISDPTRDLELMTVKHHEVTDNDANNHGEDNLMTQVQVDEHAKSSNLDLENATLGGGCLSSSTPISKIYLIKDIVDSVTELGDSFNNDEWFADLKSNSCSMAVELLENETPKVLRDQDSSHLSSQAKTNLRIKMDNASADKIKEVKSRAREIGYAEEAEGVSICGSEEAQSGQVLSNQTKSVKKEFFSEQAGSVEGAITEAVNSTINQSFQSYCKIEFGEEMEIGLNVHSSLLVAVSKNNNNDGEVELVEECSLMTSDPRPSAGHGKDSDNSSSNTAEVYGTRWQIASGSIQTLQENVCTETLQNGEPVSFEDSKDNKGKLVPEAELSHVVPPESEVPNNMISPALVSEMHYESESITGQNPVNYASTREMGVLGLTSISFSNAEAEGDYEAEIAVPGDNYYSAMVESHSFGEIKKGNSVIVGGSKYAHEEKTQNHSNVANRIGQKNVNKEEDACAIINDDSATTRLEESSPCNFAEGSDFDTIIAHEETNPEAEIEFNTYESAAPNNMISPILVREIHNESESITGQNSVNYASTREMEVLGLTSIPFSAAEAEGDYEAEIAVPGDNYYSAIVESLSFGEIEKGTGVIVGGSEYAQEAPTQNHMDVANKIGQKNVNKEEDACMNINDDSATTGLEESSPCDTIEGSDVDTIIVHGDTNPEAELNTNEGNCMSVEFTNQEHRGGHVDPKHTDACMTEKDQAAVSSSGCLESSPCATSDMDWAPKLVVHSESRSLADNACSCTQVSDFAKSPDVRDPEENLRYSVEKGTRINPFTSLSINTISESLIATRGDLDGTSSERGNSEPNSEDDSAHLPCIGDSSEERVVDGSVGDISAISNGIEEHAEVAEEDFSKSERKIAETDDGGDNIADIAVADSSSPFVPENTTDQHMDPTESASQQETNITALLDDADNECTQPNIFTDSEIDLFWGEWEAEKEESGKLPKETLDSACPVDEFEIADVEYDTISIHKPAIEKSVEDGNLASWEQEKLGNNEIEGRSDEELLLSSVIQIKNNLSNSKNEDFSNTIFTDSEIEMFWGKTEKEQIRELQAEPLDAMCLVDEENVTADTHQSVVEKILEPLDSGKQKLIGNEEGGVSVAQVRDVKSGKGVKKSEGVHNDNKGVRSSIIQKENKRSILIHGTPKKLPQIMSDMKENTTAQKTRPVVDVTAAKPSLRKALQKIG